MDFIPYETSSYYVFDRAYNDFERLALIDSLGCFFTIRARRNSMTSRVAELYKNRWLVEWFFKWLKQHLKIKKFWGTSENAVKIQIHVAIITYCLVAIVHHDMKLNRFLYEILQILGISLTDKTPLQELLAAKNLEKQEKVEDEALDLFDNLFLC